MPDGKCVAVQGNSMHLKVSVENIPNNKGWGTD